MSKKYGPIELTLEIRDGYLYAHAKGETVTMEHALQYHRAVVDECADLKVNRLMLVRDIPVALPLDALHLMTKSLVDHLWGIRMAYVNPYPANADALHFGAIVALQRGVTYKVFDNDADAEKWLLQDIPH